MKKVLTNISFLIVLLLLTIVSGCNNLKVEFIDYDDSIIKTTDVNDLEKNDMPIAIRKGYTFIEWNITRESKKITYKATYKPNKYKIFLSIESEVLPFESISVDYDSMIEELPIPDTDKSFFVGWQYNGKIVSLPFIYEYDENITLNAIYFYKVNFLDYNGSIIKEIEVESLDDAICDEPTREGYTFTGWEKLVKNDKVEYRAKFTPNSYTITFDTDGGSFKEKMVVDYNSQVSFISTPTKNRYDLVGWSYNDEIISLPFTYKFTNDITLKAVWRLKDKVQVDYVDYDGSLIQSFQVYDPDETMCEEPTRNGYSFIKWEKSLISNKIVFTALYVPNKYDIIFDSDGGNSISKTSMYYLDTISNLPIPTKVNYIFEGWMYNDNLITYPFRFNYTENITLKAKWRLKELIYVEYLDYDDTLIKEMQVYYIDNATCIEPERKGYTFLDWEKQVIDQKVIFRATYKANTYKITFVSNSLNGISSSTIKYGTTITGLPIPSKNNYYFMGWYLNDVKVEIPYVYETDNDVVLFGRWEKSNYPSVAYNEFNEFMFNLNNLLSSANQYHIDSQINTKITMKHSLIGKIEVNDKQAIYTRYDKTNGYLENKLSATGMEHYYEIYRRVGDITYLDELFSNNGMYTLYSSINNEEIDFNQDEINFSGILNENNSYRKIGENHYLAYTKLGALTFNGIDLDSLAREIGISKEILKEADIEIELTFNNTTKQIAYAVNLNEFSFTVDDVLYSLDISSSSIYRNYNEEIIPFDYNQPNVFLPKAKSFDEATDLTDISKPIESYEVLGPHYYKVYLEAGQYSSEVTGVIVDDIIIYDINKNLYDLGPLWDTFLVSKYQFVIRESNYYYLKVNNSTSDTYQVQINKLNYDSISDFNNPTIIKENNSVNFEGEYDFQYYLIDSLDDGILIIEEIQNDISVLYKGISTNFKIPKSTGNKFIVPINKGKNYIIINAYAKITVQFKSEFFKDNVDTTTDINKMPLLTTNFSDDYYSVGYSCKNDYFKIVITEANYYKIEFDHFYFNSDPNISFYNKSGGTAITNYNRVHLSPGTYYVVISNNNYNGSIVRVRLAIAN